MNNMRQDPGETSKMEPDNKGIDQQESTNSSGVKSTDAATMFTFQEKPKSITEDISSGFFQKKPFVIGIAGAAASGKSTICFKIKDKLMNSQDNNNNSTIMAKFQKQVICISLDSFYRKLDENERAEVAKGNFDFDNPAAFDKQLLVRTIKDVLNGQEVKVPVYDYMKNEISMTEEVTFKSADIVLVSGSLLFCYPEVLDMFQLKIFVDADLETCLNRRANRDTTERNRKLCKVLNHYTKFVKPSFEKFCLPTRNHADIIVPSGPDNEVAIDLIVTHLQSIFDPFIRHNSIKPPNH